MLPSGENMSGAGLNAGVYPQYDRNVNYYQEFWRTYLHNELLISKMKDYSMETREIQAKIHRYEEMIHAIESGQNGTSPTRLKKKNRRTAAQIQKNYTCPYQGCNKTYGTDVSLNLHIKLKHNGGNKTEREKIARQVYLAKIKGEDIPDVDINLPPGYVDKVGTQTFKRTRRKSQNKGKNGEEEDPSKKVVDFMMETRALMSEFQKQDGKEVYGDQ
eukprot:TRINITY_DN3205_c0_g1_i2.p1 TRINITY_DN3205_c0_g1~~TRINITY_DN3205_c0_g1_i2.p1  ORF type:complete len:216 (+),score=3.77 TRINITY_DN3205_c0_g1_i2:213-860(+)